MAKNPDEQNTDVFLNKKTIHHWQIVMDNVARMKENPRPVGHAMDAEELLECAIKYFKWCDEHPIYVPEMVRSGKKTGTTYYMPKQRPYTISGLCIHLGISQSYVYDCAKSKTKDQFYFVATTILQVIFTQKLELGITGVFNAIITAKDLGINEQEKIERGSPTVNIEVVGDIQQLPDNETDESKPDFPQLENTIS